ncbi:hypothetical protein CEV31_3686 [Brucella thiophenivorans]|uniref:Uncharacterized protein n=1 Tax=Brucella thiophenivorans TaxID=571255 RepID=A0A256FBG3_9HYPH|nr:hypothetical protein CEV31_3686 [Brucella thiophenivorans]
MTACRKIAFFIMTKKWGFAKLDATHSFYKLAQSNGSLPLLKTIR